MKNVKKVLVAVLAMCLILAACGCTGTQDKGKIKVGVIQFMANPSLDNCYEGIAKAFADSGLDYEIVRQTGSSNAAVSDCSTFAKNMVGESYDIIIAIATPAAQAAFTATADTDIPVIFSAVSDPVEAKLVKSNEAPGYNCSGTSDVLDLEAQVDLIQAMQPDVKKIGILYTSSEANSISNLENFKKICAARNLEVVAKAVQSATDIPSQAEDLAQQVDCINNFTDNNVVNNLATVLAAANAHNIPVYGSEEEQVKNGCLASVSIDYVALGVVTGEMAVSVLKGEDISKLAVRTITDATPIVNTEVLASLGMTMPEAYTNATTVTTAK